MLNYEYHKLRAQRSVLVDVLKDYPTSTIQNVITQIESRIKFLEEHGSKNE